MSSVCSLCNGVTTKIYIETHGSCAKCYKMAQQQAKQQIQQAKQLAKQQIQQPMQQMHTQHHTKQQIILKPISQFRQLQF